MFPTSSTVWPNCFNRACRPATRRAEGPMSTPRRLWPRSMGTPIILTFCAMLLFFQLRIVRILRVYPINHARKGYHFPDVLCAANPGYSALQAQAKAGVGHATVAAEVQIPLEWLLGQLVFVEALHQQVVIVNALAAANNFSVSF